MAQVPSRPPALALSSPQLATVKRTVAKELTDTEFDLFMEACRSYSLDPFRSQIIPQVFNKGDKDKRRMTLIVTRDGLRVIASRQGDYRPASKPPTFETDQALKTRAAKDGLAPNPLGLISATVELYKLDARSGEWFPVSGIAYWDEYAPRAGDAFNYSQWPKMPRVMLAKCAEAAALRAGWPDAMAGLYVAEEMQAAQADTMRDVTPSEAAAKAEEDRRASRVSSGPSVLFAVDNGPMRRVVVGECFDWLMAHLKDADDDGCLRFVTQNEESLRDFWTYAPTDALEFKKWIEPRVDAARNAAKSKPDPGDDEAHEEAAGDGGKTRKKPERKKKNDEASQG